MTTQLKWGMQVGGLYYLPGTEVRLATLEEARMVFPAIRSNPDSTQVAIWLPKLTHPTIVHRSQLGIPTYKK